MKVGSWLLVKNVDFERSIPKNFNDGTGIISRCFNDIYSFFDDDLGIPDIIGWCNGRK
jgi:hypothetical protein